MPSTLQDAGRIALAASFKAQPLHVAWGTGDPAWDAMTRGLSEPQSESLAWQVNEQFLRSQMESGVHQIDYELLGKFAALLTFMWIRERVVWRRGW